MEVVTELFNLLESNNQLDVEEAKKRFHEHFNSTKESWLVHGIFDYFINSGSLRSVDILVSVREPHDKYLFDRIAESLRTAHKLQALTLLGHVVRRHPTWLYKIINHQLIRDLIRLLKVEKEVLPLMSALLIVIILLPIIAGLFGPHLQEIFEVFSHLASWNTNNPNKVPDGQLLHLQIGLYALFNRLYGMYPCNFLNYLRHQYSAKENLPVFSHTIKPMLETVKVHPLLITASRDVEISAARWKKMEANDVIMECAKFSIEPGSDRWKEDCSFRARTSSFRSRNIDFSRSLFDSTSGLDVKTFPVIGNFSTNLPDSNEIFSPTVFTASNDIESAPTSITHTPAQNYTRPSNYSSQEGNSPPEAAIEATPESTPVKDLRQSIRPSSTSFSRSLSSFSAQSQPSSPMKKESSPFRFPPSSTPVPSEPSAFQVSTRSNEKRNRVLQERDAVLKPKTPNLSSYQPSSPLRVISTPVSFDWSNVSSPQAHHERTEEDREVESMMRADNNLNSSLRRGDSVVQEEEHEEYEECIKAEVGGCIEGGLHMPDSRTMMQFARQVNRLRFHSQCQPDTFQLAQIGVSSGSSPRDGATFPETKVRRAISCPEMKKETSFTGAISELGVTALEEDDEEEDHIENTIKINEGVKKSSVCTQTDDPPPLVYEPLFLSIFPPFEQIQQHSAPPDVTHPPSFRETPTTFPPHTALESFIETTIRGLNERRKSFDNNELKNVKQHLELVMLQLQFEKHRREVHAERNRRLLGKSRTNRALEEHNLALQHQVSSMQEEIKTLHNELDRNKREAKHNCDQLQENLNYWQEQTSTLQRKYKEAQGQICLLEKQLEEDQKEIKSLKGDCTKSRAEVFELRNTLEGAIVAATAGREIKSELASLQLRLVGAGELETRLRSTVSSLTLRCHKNVEALMATHSYSQHLSELKTQLKLSDSAVEAAKAKVNDANNIIEQQKSLNQDKEKIVESVISNYTEKLKESEDTCTKLRNLYTEREEMILELHHKIEMLEDQCKKLSRSKNSNSEVLQGSPSLSAINSGIMPIVTTRLQNLQLLVDKNEAGPSRDNSLL